MTTLTAAHRAPGPSGDFLLGCLREFRRDPIALLLNCARRYGDVVRLKIGPVTAHLVNHPDHIEHVLVQNASGYDKQTRSVAKIQATCGRSLLSTDGDTWRKHRRLIQPAFQTQSVLRFVPGIVDATDRMLDRWDEAAATGTPLDMVWEMMQVTLTIASRALFGAEVAGDAACIERSLAIILRDTWRRLESWVDFSDVSPALHRREFREALEAIDQIVYRLIRARRREGTSQRDLLSLLIEARDAQQENGLNDQELRDACITLLLAGHETTANALAWCLRLVAQSPQVAARLSREADEVLTGPVRTAADLDKLSFTQHVFAETLRLYPSIWIMERRVVTDDQIAGFHLPAKSTLLISPYVMHRHPQFWDQPEVFDPTRFSAESTARRANFAYLPFGAGPHQCVGRPMAQLVAQIVVAKVFQRYQLHLLPGQSGQPRPGITLRHAQPLQMTIAKKGDAAT
jgi:cytochrome P450